jgi:hypothetical protein
VAPLVREQATKVDKVLHKHPPVKNQITENKPVDRLPNHSKNKKIRQGTEIKVQAKTKFNQREFFQLSHLRVVFYVC